MTHPLRMRICLPAIAAAIAAALTLPGGAAGESVVPAQVIVRYEPGSSPADRAEARADAGTKPIEGLGMARAQLLKITDGDSVAATVNQLEAQPGVAYAEPNGILQPASVPNDPGFSQQWGLFNDGQNVNGTTGTIGADISAPSAWNIETGDPNTIVAVMDTGADLTHPDLQNELWTNPAEAGGTPGVDDDHNGYIDDVHGYDFVGAGGPTPSDRTGHGTHVSGIIAAQGDNGIATTGVAQHTSLMELRVCGTYSSGCAMSDMVSAINYAGANGARVLNGSIQGGTYYQSLQDALKNNPNLLYVFAAGNWSQNNDVTPSYPCALDQSGGYSANNVICVAATDQSDQLASFSNYGASSVDLGAPGVNILSTSARKNIFADDFEGDFSQWTNTAGPGWSIVSEPPVNQPPFDPANHGITDSPGADYAPNTVNEVTSNPVALPAGYSTCELDYWRERDLSSGDTFQIAVLLDTNDPPDGTPDVTLTKNFTTSSSGQNTFLDLNPQFDQGGQVQVRLRLTSDATGEADGVHMDNIKLICHGSPSDGGTEFLDGTSMATPMVSGAAALLFSQAPLSTPSQVKTELLNSVDPVPSLSGKTVTGGRLNVYRALIGDFNPASSGGGGGSGASGGSGSSARKPDTFFNRKPGRIVLTHKRSAKVVFRFGSDQAGSGFECRVDGLPYVPCTKRYALRLLPGRHVLKVKAVASDGGIDPTAAVAKFRVRQILG
jgi:subtilisin family serine protease